MRYVSLLTFILPVTLAAQDGAGEGCAPKQDSKLLILMVGPARRS